MKKKKFRPKLVKLKAKTPKILIVSGVAGLVSAVPLGIFAWEKTRKDREEFKEKRESLNYISESCPEENVKKDLVKLYVKTWLKMGVKMAPIAALETVSALGIFKGYKIEVKRGLETAALLATYRDILSIYRKRVVEEYGEDVDKRFRYGLEVLESEIESDGETNTVKEYKNPKIHKKDRYTFVLDKGCEGWDDDIWYLLQHISATEAYFNNHIKSQKEGYRFQTLVPILFELCIPEDQWPEGCLVDGWVYDKEKDGGKDPIKFDVTEAKDDSGNPIIIIEMNCQGDISSYI